MTKRLLLFLLGSVWALSSCIDSTSSVQVNEDGSATLQATRRLDTRFSDNYVSDNGSKFSPGEADIKRICDQLALSSGYPENATIKPTATSSTCGVAVSLDVPADGNPAEQLAQLEKSAFGPISSLFTTPEKSEYVVERRDDVWIFKMPTPSVNRLETKFLTKQDAESILARSTFSYEVTLPGTAIPNENNADAVEGGTFRWDIDPTGGSVELEARTQPPEESLWQRFGLLGLGGLAVLLLAVAVVLGFRFGKKKGLLSKRPFSRSTAADSSEQARPDDAAPATAETKPEPRDLNPMPDLTSLPLGASKPRWNDDAEMWMADHQDKGLYFFDDKTARWAPLR